MAFKILSLDGGGSWALIQARVLARRYDQKIFGHEILREYDMVIANSGGSLVLALLCANVQLEKIIDTFEDVNVLKSIFDKKFVSRIPYLKDFLPNYDTQNKYEVFKKHLDNGNRYGDKLLTELPELIGNPLLEIIITGFDYDRERAVYFRSNKESRMESKWIEQKVSGTSSDKFKTVTLAQAIHASSNAPVQYFDDPAAFPLTVFEQDDYTTKTKKHLFWDGAVGGNNNPVKAAVLEALANGKTREEIQIISIGTSSTICPVLYGEPNECKPETGKDFLCRTSQIDGWIDDLKRMASSILSDPPDAATFEAHQILGLEYKQNDPRLIRINPLVKPRRKGKKWMMPGNSDWDSKQMGKLFTLDMAVATDEGVDLINKLCDDFFKDLFDNQGIRIGGADITPILGHRLFSHALKDWNSPLWQTS